MKGTNRYSNNPVDIPTTSNNDDEKLVVGYGTCKITATMSIDADETTATTTIVTANSSSHSDTHETTTTMHTNKPISAVGVSGKVTTSSSSTTTPGFLPPSYQATVQLWPKEIRNIIAGGIAGIIAKSVVAPVDRIKILYQVSSVEFRLKNLPIVVRNIIQEEGISALWKGNSATLLRVFPYSGIQFMVFDRIKLSILTNKKQQQLLQQQQSSSSGTSSGIQRQTTVHQISSKFGLTPVESLAAGMIAGAISVVCTYPLDLARAQLAVLKKHKHGPNKGFRQILYDNYKIKGLFRGMTPTLLGILPYSGIAFALNEQGKRKIQYMTGRDLTTVERMECGAFAGLFAQSVAYPIEVTRRRMQTAGLTHQSNTSDTALDAVKSTTTSSSTKTTVTQPPKKVIVLSKQPNLMEIIKELYAEQGVRGFYKGVSMNWIKGPVAFSISFTMFDIVQSFLESPAEQELRTPRRRFTTRTSS